MSKKTLGKIQILVGVIIIAMIFAYFFTVNKQSGGALWLGFFLPFKLFFTLIISNPVSFSVCILIILFFITNFFYKKAK